MPFMHMSISGVAHGLLRLLDSDGDTFYEPADAKLARYQAKPAHVFQLWFYADAIETLAGLTLRISIPGLLRKAMIQSDSTMSEPIGGACGSSSPA